MRTRVAARKQGLLTKTGNGTEHQLPIQDSHLGFSQPPVSLFWQVSRLTKKDGGTKQLPGAASCSAGTRAIASVLELSSFSVVVWQLLLLLQLQPRLLLAALPWGPVESELDHHRRPPGLRLQAESRQDPPSNSADENALFLHVVHVLSVNWGVRAGPADSPLVTSDSRKHDQVGRTSGFQNLDHG
eukprot:3125420-Rhodomonas_salina.2